ncbi:MAG: glycosyltransferase [Pseudomonadota bacterium]
MSHAADRTGAPISTLALTKAWAERGDVDVKMLLRRDGPLREEFGHTLGAEGVFLARPAPEEFGLLDAAAMAVSGQPEIALKGLRNTHRPYVLSRKDKSRTAALRDVWTGWRPNAIYASTTHCGDAIEPLGLKAPILTHVREMRGVIAALDKERRDFALNESAAFAVVSGPVRETLIQDWHVDHDRIMVEPPAIDLEIVLNVSAETAPETSKPFIIGIGSLIPRKGPDLFLDAAKAATELGSDMNFIWLGDGEMRADLEAATARLGLSDRVHWLGQVSNPYPYLKHAKALALTSREDPHPRTMIEAAALGTPIVAFESSGGADHFIPEHMAGALVQMADTGAMANALMSDELPKADAAQIQKRYDVKASAERLLNQLKALTV